MGQVGSFWCTVCDMSRASEPHWLFPIPQEISLLRHDLKIIERGLHKEGPPSFNIRILIIS